MSDGHRKTPWLVKLRRAVRELANSGGHPDELFDSPEDALRFYERAYGQGDTNSLPALDGVEEFEEPIIPHASPREFLGEDYSAAKHRQLERLVVAIDDALRESGTVGFADQGNELTLAQLAAAHGTSIEAIRGESLAVLRMARVGVREYPRYSIWAADAQLRLAA